MAPLDRPRDAFRYGPEDVASFAERFTVEPVAPTVIRDRLDDGRVLVTTDVPDYLDRSIASDADPGIALYRLVQLFGTPNVPGLEAGADQPMRERTTWQYLFRVGVGPAADVDDTSDAAGTDAAATDATGADAGATGEAPAAGREDLLSVYDYRTDLSVGISEWHRRDGESDRVVREPSPEPLPSGAMPAEAHLERLVKLVLSTVEPAVEATYDDLRV